MHTERRKHPRFQLSEGRVWTGRWSSPDVFETSASLVNDLSLGGAKVLTSSAPVVGEFLWIRPALPGNLQTVRAKVLEVQTVSPGNYRVRLEFDTASTEPFVTCLLQDSAARTLLRRLRGSLGLKSRISIRVASFARDSSAQARLRIPATLTPLPMIRL